MQHTASAETTEKGVGKEWSDVAAMISWCHTVSLLIGFLFSLPSSAASDANTDDVIEYQWSDVRPIDMPDNLEVAQFDFVRAPKTIDDKQVFETGKSWGGGGV